jgi:hypothetical protein
LSERSGDPACGAAGSFIGLEDLIRNKEKIRRPKDVEDLKYLKKAREKQNNVDL